MMDMWSYWKKNGNTELANYFYIRREEYVNAKIIALDKKKVSLSATFFLSAYIKRDVRLQQMRFGHIKKRHNC